MTPEQLHLVETTAATLDVDALAVDFYRRAFRREAALSSMFTADPAVQRARFAAELHEIVASIRRLDRFGPTVRALGARHGAYGGRPGHYRLMGEVLLEALAVAVGPGWTTETEDAWRMAYHLTAETMLAGALED